MNRKVCNLIAFLLNWVVLSFLLVILRRSFIRWSTNTNIGNYSFKHSILYGAAICLLLYIFFFVFKLMKYFKRFHILLSALYFAIICYVLYFIMGIFIGNARPSIVWKPVLSMFILGFLLPLGHRFWKTILFKHKDIPTK